MSIAAEYRRLPHHRRAEERRVDRARLAREWASRRGGRFREIRHGEAGGWLEIVLPDRPAVVATYARASGRECALRDVVERAARLLAAGVRER